MKSSVLYSISCGCAFAFLLIGILSLALGNSSCYAVVTGHEPDVDAGTISPVTTPTPTASLTLSNSDMKSDPVTPGSIATTSTDVTVDVKNASSYSLTLSFEKVDLTNGSTTIVPGNPNDSTSSNVWGYTWDGASTYTTPAVSGNTLIPTTNLSSDTTFTKTLAFGAKFANNADPGEYKTRGTLSLAVSPKAAVVITLENLTQMQQLAEGYAPDACKNTEIPAGKDYAGPYSLTDVRDNNKYTVYKFKDGKCWMTENLKLSTMSNGVGYSGRILYSSTSDIAVSSWDLPSSSKSGFNDSDMYQPKLYVENNTGYYNWYTATAGAGNASVTTNGANVTSSICPKGWRLPSGGSGGEYEALINAEGIENSSEGYSKIGGTPYNFTPTRYMVDGSLKYHSSMSSYAPSDGYWWSRTSSGGSSAYSMHIINTDTVTSGTYSDSRSNGYAVRCIAG